MTTLKDAQKSGNLEKFIKEHEKDAPADLDQLKGTVKNLALDIKTDAKFIKKGKTDSKV